MTQQLVRFYRSFRSLGYSAQDAHRMAQGKVYMFREGIYAAAYQNSDDESPVTLVLVQESGHAGEAGIVLSEVAYDSSWLDSLPRLEQEEGAFLAYEHSIRPERK